MLDWTENELFHQMPPSCRRSLASFGGPDEASALREAWDHCQDAVALLWLAALRVRHNEGRDRKVHEEIARAKARVLERVNNPTTEPARQAEHRLVNQLDQPLAVLDSPPRAFDRLAEWNQALEEPMGRELWVEYARRMAGVVEGIRINLRDVVVD